MLLGPRGVGKSTLINQGLKFELEISLLQSKYFLPLKANPSLLEEWTKGLKAGAMMSPKIAMPSHWLSAWA